MAAISLRKVWHLGIKEWWSLWRDPVMLVLILYTFTAAVYIAATAQPDTLTRAALAVVDEDESQLSQRLRAAFVPPQFMLPEPITLEQADARLDRGRATFVLVIPAGFQRRILAGRIAPLQLNVDATRMSQAFTGSTYVQQIALGEIEKFLHPGSGASAAQVDLSVRARFNPALAPSWFGGVAELVNNVTMLSVILTGAALIREREHGTVEHLLVMPVGPLEIMLAKLWSMGSIVLAATLVALSGIVRGLLGVQLGGSIVLFMAGTMVHLFAVTSLGILLATLARGMPQFGILVVLVLLPLQMLSGANTPRESIPWLLRDAMLAAPTTHYVELSQAILFRGAGLDVVWPRMLALLLIGAVLFVVALARFGAAMRR
ncbi:ABC transporter permease [Telluria mixta]|uniref:ABC transporter permease n=1 Tax=Telluria mixta TaxID=34071 RepID=A0ABT2BT00_9BURK|nr:ABC transporter permease [Telluria mixta]MCS0628244.1 ABC transporter permease [Telluria mixta]WEM93642.1 ABC transporter permease [Telluria mixta]